MAPNRADQFFLGQQRPLLLYAHGTPPSMPGAGREHGC
jgi:hypothetical protein